MQIIKWFFKLTFFLFPCIAFGQSTHIPLGTKAYSILDRLEIKAKINPGLNYSSVKPFSRKFVVQELLSLDSAGAGRLDSLGNNNFNNYSKLNLTKVDKYNIQSILGNNSEWVEDGNYDFSSKRPFLKTFYKSKYNFFEVNNKDIFLAINPLLQLNASYEKGNDQQLYLNSRGISVRGLIAKKIGFYATIVDNQERGPSYFTQTVRSLKAVPGNGFFKSFKKDTTAVDYFDARGSLTFNAAKFIDFQIGYDKNFIGDGYRSLFLSDFTNANLFVKINTRIWKFNYQNLFMELMPRYTKNAGDSLLDRKYAAMHHLSMNVTKWLNIGLFEGVIFGRSNHFDFQYMNPIIFYRHIEGMVGSPDNAVAGLDFKANLVNRVQVYGQLLLDEFLINNVRKNPTSWTNKFGFQLGAKYVDAFGIHNLDLQFETNRVRPFTYSHNNLVANYTHYNQPLAHPLGANFQEFIGIARFQPAPKWYVLAKAFYYYKGLDTAGVNFGGNIFLDNKIISNGGTRLSNDGFKVGDGNKTNVLFGSLDVSYELRENFFIDFSFQQRNQTFQNNAPTLSSTMITGGIRVNLEKRKYDY